MATEQRKTICVIGAGISGLPAIKSCLEEGLEPVCYEATGDLGGLWNWRSLGENHSTVMKSTIVNTSKEMFCYSDMPIDADIPNFMHNSRVLQYLRDYATRFDLLKHIRYNTQVVKVTQSDDYASTGRWLVTTDAGETRVFDGVLVCTGHHAFPNRPDMPGLKQFKGKVMHSQAYHDYKGHEGQRVVVIGIGNSALDVAVELAGHSKSLCLSTRRGSWVWARVGPNGVPYDVYWITRYWNTIKWMAGLELSSRFFEMRANRMWDHALYGLRPAHRFFQQHPSVNDPLPNLCLSGQLTIKGDVREFKEHSIVFDDGSETEADLVILGTGYTIGYPFIQPPSLVPVHNNRVSLYKLVWPTGLQHSSLAFIGLVQPYGSVSPISEMQSRWAARVLAGACRLPSKDRQLAEVDDRQRKMRARYVESPRHTVQCDFVDIMDEYAEEIGVEPRIGDYFFTDFLFFMQLYFGPAYPYMYRLRGPHAWTGARDAILTARERIILPLHQRPVRMREWKTASWSGFARYIGKRYKFYTMIIIIYAFAYFMFGYMLGMHSPLLFATISIVFFSVLIGFVFATDLIRDHSTVFG